MHDVEVTAAKNIGVQTDGSRQRVTRNLERPPIQLVHEPLLSRFLRSSLLVRHLVANS